MKRFISLLTTFMCILALQSQNAVVVDVKSVQNEITPYLYGACMEDVNHEIYGGLYIQKIYGESFEEDYQEMTVNNFDRYGGKWSFQNNQLSVKADDGAKILNKTSIVNGSVEVEMKFSDIRESAALIIRTSNAQIGADNWDGYEIGLEANTKEIILGKHMHDWQPISRTLTSFDSNDWTKVRVDFEGARIRVYLNDSDLPQVDYSDQHAVLLEGNVGLRTWRSDVSFRNLKIKTNGVWEDLTFEGDVHKIGHWEILQEDNQVDFISDDAYAYNGKLSQKIVYHSGSGKAGLINGGLNGWGIDVKENRSYEGRLYLQAANFSGKVHIALQSADGQTIYAKNEFDNINSSWDKYPFTLVSNTTDNDARFAVWIEDKGTVWIDQVVLEGTGEERFHGLPYRADIGDAMVDQGLTFLRYGGSMINAPEYRFKKMIGDVDLRPPYRGWWYPYSTNGFGIEDFLKFCEAAGFEPSFAINIEETAQDAADMIEYLNGDISTEWGAKRAANGHPEPYNVKYIEIGNEEVLFNGDVSAEYSHYIERFLELYEAMIAKDPNLVFINAAWWRPESSNMKRVFDALNGKAAYWDYHPWTDELDSGKNIELELKEMQRKFKEWDPNTTMKCAIFEENGNTHNLQRALAHATVLNTVRRMSDFVLTTCAANALQPYLQNDNGWDQGQVFFTPSQVWGMPPFYSQQMAANAHKPLLVNVAGRGLRLDVTATTDANESELVLHIVNTDPNNMAQTFEITNFSSDKIAQVVQLTGNLNDRNSPENPERIIPQHYEVMVEDNKLSHVFPAYSYTIITFKNEASSVNTAKKNSIKIHTMKNGLKINCNSNYLNSDVEIFSIVGERLYKGLLSDYSTFINLIPGEYVVSISGKESIVNEKIIVL